VTHGIKGVWKKKYYKLAQETKQKVLEIIDSELLRKKHFIFKYWIIKDSTEDSEKDNELISFINGQSKKLKETDITFNLINW
jgi:hypothetical protein